MLEIPSKHPEYVLPRYQLELHNDVDTCAVVSPNGAYIRDVTQLGEHILLPDAQYSTGTEPKRRGGTVLLFPWAGPRNGNLQHGYGRNRDWRPTEVAAAHARMTLNLDPEGYLGEAIYDVSLLPDLPTVRQTLTVINAGHEPMPLAPGFHPYFALPVTKRTALKTNIPNFNPTTHDWSKPLVLPGQREILLEMPRGIIIMTTSDTLQKLVLWAQPGLDAICVEPWAAVPGALDTDHAPALPGLSQVQYSVTTTFHSKQ